MWPQVQNGQLPFPANAYPEPPDWKPSLSSGLPARGSQSLRRLLSSLCVLPPTHTRQELLGGRGNRCPHSTEGRSGSVGKHLPGLESRSNSCKQRKQSKEWGTAASGPSWSRGSRPGIRAWTREVCEPHKLDMAFGASVSVCLLAGEAQSCHQLFTDDCGPTQNSSQWAGGQQLQRSLPWMEGPRETSRGARAQTGAPRHHGTPICVCSWDRGCLWPAVPSVGSMTPNQGRTGTKADAGSADRTGMVEAFGHSPLNSGVHFSSLTRSSRLPLYLPGETALVLESSPFY